VHCLDSSITHPRGCVMFWQMCDLDVYTYLYQSDLREYQVESSLSLQVSDFIIVPVTNNVERPMESRSPQSTETDSDSEEDMSLRPASLGAIPAWDDTTETSPTEGTLNLQKVFYNAVASQGSSPHFENAVGRLVSVDAPNVQYGVLENPDAANPHFSLSDLQTVEQANEIEMQLEEKLARLRKRKESLQSVAVNPSSSNPLQISATVGDAVGRDKDDNIMQAVGMDMVVCGAGHPPRPPARPIRPLDLRARPIRVKRALTDRPW
jgi:hypothetical protein